MTGPPFTSATATTVTHDGRTLVAFAGCNYLGLAQHPQLLTAAAAAIPRFGLSTSASRHTSGHTALHEHLERDIARHLASDDALLLPDGYIANLAALQALAAIGITHALIDERAHQSLRDAATMAGLTIRAFATTDPEDARAQAASLPLGRFAILTDGVFTTDGRLAPLPELAAINAPLLVDDCHGFGIVGPAGAGTPALLGIGNHPSLITTSTLAKGIGCGGGFVAGSAAFVRTARARSSAFICTTPTAPPLVAAAIEALRIARTDDARRARLAHNIAAVRALLLALNLPTHDADTPIFAFAPSADLGPIEASLKASGVYIPLMDYPHGPAPRFFRLSVNAEHTDADLKALHTALESALAPAIGVPSRHA